jgi:hypothetical protein
VAQARGVTRLLRLLTIVGLLGWLFGCDTNKAPYQRKDGAWHFEDEALPGVKELTVLNRRFAKSATQVFFRATPITGADPASFEALDEHHARDRLQVWHADTYRDSRDYFTTKRIRIRRLDGADPASFALLREDYARDARKVWHEGDSFPVKDAASFEVLDHGFARDRHQGYYLRATVTGSDGASFSVLDAHHARDATSVFHAHMDLGQSPPRVVSRRIAEADLASFAALDSSGYARDARRVYWHGRPLRDADPSGFALLPSGTPGADAADARGRYSRGEVVTP